MAAVSGAAAGEVTVVIDPILSRQQVGRAHLQGAGQGLDPTGVTNLLMKPFTADTLARRIKELMQQTTEIDGRNA